MLACDGIWDVLTCDQVANFIADHLKVLNRLTISAFLHDSLEIYFVALKFTCSAFSSVLNDVFRLELTLVKSVNDVWTTVYTRVQKFVIFLSIMSTIAV